MPRRLLAVAALTLLALAATAPRLTAQTPVEVTTGVFELSLSPRGAQPVQWTVYDPAGQRVGTGPRFALVDPEVAAGQPDGMFAVRIDGEPDQRNYEVTRATTETGEAITFTAPADANGLQVSKTYEFSREGPLFGLRIGITNTGASQQEAKVELAVGPGLGYSMQRKPEIYEEGLLEDILPFIAHSGSVWSVPVPSEEPFSAPYPPVVEGEETERTPLDWFGIHTQFFLVAVQPEQLEPGHFESATVAAARTEPVADTDSSQYPIVRLARTVTLAPGASDNTPYTVYAGPKDRDLLVSTGRNLEPVIFHYLWDWLAGICLVLQSFLAWLAGLVGSHGLAIIVFALLFRIVTLPLSIYGAKQQVLMKDKMAELKPKIAEAKAQYKGEKRDQAIMKLYKDHGVNPLGQFKGCLPLAIQLPVMIALFNVLLVDPALRGQSFLWVSDLALTDRLFPLGFTLPWLGSYFNLLPVIMLGAQLLTGMMMSKASQSDEGLSPAALLIMPLSLFLLFYPFPAGCMLFWTTGTLFQVFEQKIVSGAVAKTHG